MKKETKKSRDTVPLNLKLKTENPPCNPEASSKMSTISEQGAYVYPCSSGLLLTIHPHAVTYSLSAIINMFKTTLISYRYICFIRFEPCNIILKGLLPENDMQASSLSSKKSTLSAMWNISLFCHKMRVL